MSYRDKLRLMIVLLLAVAVGFSGAWLITASFDAALNREIAAAQTEQRMTLYSLIAAAGGVPDSARTAEWISAVRTLEQQTGQSFRLISESRGVLYLSEGSASFIDGLTDQATAERLAWRIARNDSGEHRLQIAGAIKAADGGLLYLETLRDVEAVYRARSELNRVFRWMLVAIAVVGALAAAILSRWLTRSLIELAKTARSITDGDLACRAVVHGSDEFGQLAADFNTMTEQLEETIHALEEAMGRQEAFMAAFAHEMRTPMTSIIGYADLLRSAQLPDDARARAANYIFTEGRRLESLSNKLLDLIVLKKQDFEKKNCVMARLVAQVGGLMDRTLRASGVSLHCQVDESILKIEPDLFKTLILNLLENARKAMPEGGYIELRAGMYEGVWRMTIRDTGCGIPAEAIAHLTDAFYRVDKSRARAQGGVGLGLRLCSEIVNLHGGRMSFDSREGEGTVVTITIQGGGI